MRAIPRRTIHLPPKALGTMVTAVLDEPAAGPARVAALEDAFARHLGARHAVAVGSGRLGLRLLLEGLGIGPGDEVLLPAYTDQSVPAAIRKAGATPVYVDVDRRTFNLDPDRLEAHRSPRTAAVIALHVFGGPAALGPIAAFAERHGLALIEDCAHAVDSASGGRACGTVGRAAIFSFVLTKAINAFGGGMVVTSDPALADHVRLRVAALPPPAPTALLRRVAAGVALRGLTRPAVFGAVGAPALRGLRAVGSDALAAYDRLVRPSTVNADVDTRFSPTQASVALLQVRAMDAMQARRRAIADRLSTAMPPLLTPQRLAPGDRHSWYFLVATAQDPDAVAAALLRRGVDVGRFPMRNVAAADGRQDCTEAEWLVQHSLQIPAYPTLTDNDVARVAAALEARA